MMKTLYNKPILTMKNDGRISKPCMMQRGVLQGCPLSALLFNFVLEILDYKFRNIQNIRMTNNDSIKIV